MRLIGARFPDRPRALHALEHVRSRFGVDDAEVAPLADENSSATLLGALIDDCCRDEARAILIDHGGEIVSDIDEAVLA